MKLLNFGPPSGDNLTHYMFRYPAKFHPPVAQTLIDRYTLRDQTVLDPFCGSGTLLVEAAVADRRVIGTDVDPVAVFVSKMKTHRFNLAHLESSAAVVLDRVKRSRRSDAEYDHLASEDISVDEMRWMIEERDLWVPQIPNLLHWFRRYVVVDLATILEEIHTAKLPETHRQFLRLCFASTIRSASNADPVPVSGLEVTAHMRRLDEAGRTVIPHDLFVGAVGRGIRGVGSFYQRSNPRVHVRIFQADAVDVATRLRQDVDVIITSPPYLGAVDYYRRHQLEMYWLGFTATHDERLRLLQKYIGRPKVANRHPYVAAEALNGEVAEFWYQRLRGVPEKAKAFKHYVVGMRKAISSLAQIVSPGSLSVFVVGNSSANGEVIPPIELFTELSSPDFQCIDCLWYPIRHRYMSYTRHNEASIDQDYVMVFERVRV